MRAALPINRAVTAGLRTVTSSESHVAAHPASRMRAMAKKAYTSIIVEIYQGPRTSGKHGTLHIRPAPDQVVPTSLDVECDSTLTDRYPVGTRFRMDVTEKYREGQGLHLYSYHGWPEVPLSDPPK